MESIGIGIIVGPAHETYARMIGAGLRGFDFYIHPLHPREGVWNWGSSTSISGAADGERDWIILATDVADYEIVLAELLPLMRERLLIVVSNADDAVPAVQRFVKDSKWIVLCPDLDNFHAVEGLRAVVYCRGTNLPLNQLAALKRTLADSLPGVQIEI